MTHISLNLRASRRVQLGTTGMEISRVGFGAWALGGGEWAVGWGPQDDAASIASIHHAVAHGINWIDTAAVYGLGHSEQVVGSALRDIPRSERPFVFTKGGLIGDTARPHDAPRQIANPASIRREVEASLQRLGVERIDLYQIHWPSEDGTPLEEYWQAMLDLKREGKVRAVGLSNHDAAQLARAEVVGHVDTLQPPFSAIRRAAAAAELPWCWAHRTGVIVYSPMQSGLLSGAFSRERARALPHNDWRSRSADFSGAGLDRNLALAAELALIARRHNVSPAAVAIAWTLAWPGVTAAIVGARSPAQVDGWVGAPAVQLTERDHYEIANAIERTGAGAGPIRPEV